MSLSICQDEPARSRGQRSWDSSKVLDSLPFKDVSTILLEASSRMTLSQVVSLPHFRLWDAMSAIEVMDPKMDPGVAVERSRRNDRERIANDVPKMAFSGKQIIAIADQLLSTEMTWLGGNVLTQTVFSCILTHVPLSVPNFIMRAFVISTLKTVSRMREEILSAKAFEEDEFVASSGDFGLVEEIGISEVIGDLQEAEDDVLLHLKLMKGKPADLKVSVKEALLLPDGSEGIQVLEALLSRIRLRRALLSVLLHFSKRNLPSVKKALSQCLAQLPLASSTIHLGSPVQGVFDAEINKKASSDLPVRKTAEVSPKDAYTQLSSICGQLQQVVSFTPTSRLRSVLYFLDTFSSTNSSQSLLPRAFLKSIVLRNDLLFGRYSFSDVVREASSAYATDIYYTMADTFIADRCERFLTSSAEAIHLFIELFCFGRARQRRRLFKIIAHFESLQAIAETIDGEIQNYLFRKSKATVTNEPFFLSSWVYHLKLNMMVSSFKMGFELDIFSPFELSTVFWYLRHLYDMHRVQIDRMKLFWTRDHKGHPEPKSSTKAGKRSGAPRNTPTTFESVSLEMEILLHSKQLYTKAMFILSAIIMQRKLIRPPNSHFYNEEISFSHRFKCFARLGSPTPPEYAHYIADFGDIVNSDLVETLSTSLMMLDEAQRYLNHLEQLGMKEEGQTDVFADVPHMSEAIMITRKTVEAILLKRDAGVLSVYAGWEVVEEAAGGCLSSEWRWVAIHIYVVLVRKERRRADKLNRAFVGRSPMPPQRANVKLQAASSSLTASGAAQAGEVETSLAQIATNSDVGKSGPPPLPAKGKKGTSSSQVNREATPVTPNSVGSVSRFGFGKASATRGSSPPQIASVGVSIQPPPVKPQQAVITAGVQPGTSASQSTLNTGWREPKTPTVSSAAAASADSTTPPSLGTNESVPPAVSMAETVDRPKSVSSRRERSRPSTALWGARKPSEIKAPEKGDAHETPAQQAAAEEQAALNDKKAAGATGDTKGTSLPSPNLGITASPTGQVPGSPAPSTDKERPASSTVASPPTRRSASASGTLSQSRKPSGLFNWRPRTPQTKQKEGATAKESSGIKKETVLDPSVPELQSDSPKPAAFEQKDGLGKLGQSSLASVQSIASTSASQTQPIDSLAQQTKENSNPSEQFANLLGATGGGEPARSTKNRPKTSKPQAKLESAPGVASGDDKLLEILPEGAPIARILQSESGSDGKSFPTLGGITTDQEPLRAKKNSDDLHSKLNGERRDGANAVANPVEATEMQSPVTGHDSDIGEANGKIKLSESSLIDADREFDTQGTISTNPENSTTATRKTPVTSSKKATQQTKAPNHNPRVRIKEPSDRKALPTSSRRPIKPVARAKDSSPLSYTEIQSRRSGADAVFRPKTRESTGSFIQEQRVSESLDYSPIEDNPPEEADVNTTGASIIRHQLMDPGDRQPHETPIQSFKPAERTVKQLPPSILKRPNISISPENGAKLTKSVPTAVRASKFASVQKEDGRPASDKRADTPLEEKRSIEEGSYMSIHENSDEDLASTSEQETNRERRTKRTRRFRPRSSSVPQVSRGRTFDRNKDRVGRSRSEPNDEDWKSYRLVDQYVIPKSLHRLPPGTGAHRHCLEPPHAAGTGGYRIENFSFYPGQQTHGVHDRPYKHIQKPPAPCSAKAVKPYVDIHTSILSKTDQEAANAFYAMGLPSPPPTAKAAERSRSSVPDPSSIVWRIDPLRPKRLQPPPPGVRRSIPEVPEIYEELPLEDAEPQWKAEGYPHVSPPKVEDLKSNHWDYPNRRNKHGMHLNARSRSQSGFKSEVSRRFSDDRSRIEYPEPVDFVYVDESGEFESYLDGMDQYSEFRRWVQPRKRTFRRRSNNPSRLSSLPHHDDFDEPDSQRRQRAQQQNREVSNQERYKSSRATQVPSSENFEKSQKIGRRESHEHPQLQMGPPSRQSRGTQVEDLNESEENRQNERRKTGREASTSQRKLASPIKEASETRYSDMVRAGKTASAVTQPKKKSRDFRSQDDDDPALLRQARDSWPTEPSEDSWDPNSRARIEPKSRIDVSRSRMRDAKVEKVLGEPTPSRPRPAASASANGEKTGAPALYVPQEQMFWPIQPQAINPYYSYGNLGPFSQFLPFHGQTILSSPPLLPNAQAAQALLGQGGFNFGNPTITNGSASNSLSQLPAYPLHQFASNQYFPQPIQTLPPTVWTPPVVAGYGGTAAWLGSDGGAPQPRFRIMSVPVTTLKPALVVESANGENSFMFPLSSESDVQLGAINKDEAKMATEAQNSKQLPAAKPTKIPGLDGKTPNSVRKALPRKLGTLRKS